MRTRARRRSWWALLTALALATSACGARFPRAAGVPGPPETASAGAPDTSVPPIGPVATPTEGLPIPEGPVETGGSSPSPSETAGPLDAGSRVGVTGTEIKLCYLIPITGAAPTPASWDKGANAYWQYLKDNKITIHGRFVKLVPKDTASDTATALTRARECLNEKAFTFLTMDRWEVVGAVAEFLEDRKIPNVIVQGPDAAVAPERTNTFQIAISALVSPRLIADYFLGSDLKGKRYAAVREDVPELEPVVERLEARLRERGSRLVAKDAIDGQGNDFSATVQKLKQANAQVVYCACAPTPLVKLAQQSMLAGYHPVWFGGAVGWGFDMTLQVGNPDKALDGARVFSSWIALSSPTAGRFKAAYKKTYPTDAPPDDLALVGWGVGEVLHAALEAAGRDLGYNTFRAAFQSLRTDPETWAPQRFGPGVRVGANRVTLFYADGDHWKQVGGFRDSF